MPIPVPGQLAESLRRSTVQVRTNGSASARRRDSQGQGSGAVIDHHEVVTNAHVIRGDKIEVESWDGKTLPATLVKLDRMRDLALLSIASLHATPIALGDSDKLRPGAPVIAVGNPFGFIGAVSTGVIHSAAAALNRSSWVCADVRLAPGNSGGPLADFQGQLVGINTMIAAGGLAFAVPSRAVQRFLSAPIPRRALGVMLRPVEFQPARFGLLVLEVVAGGAAERASILPGDILVAANNRSFTGLDELPAAIEDAPDSLLRLDFYRGNHNILRHVTVRLSEDRVRSAA